MMSDITIIGEPLFTEDPDGKLKSRIATAFPRFHAIVTLPGIHATQIDAFVEWLHRAAIAGRVSANARGKGKGGPRRRRGPRHRGRYRPNPS